MPAPSRLLLGLAYLAFISLGLPDTVLGVAWPSLRSAFALSPAAFGVVQGAGVAGYFVSGLVAGRLAGALGVGGLLAASSALVTAGLVGYAAAPTFALFAPVGLVVGLGSGAIDAALNGYAARHFPVRHLNWLHACYSLGATAGPALMTGALAAAGSFRAGYAALAAALAAMALAFAATRRAFEDGGHAPAAAAVGAEPAAGAPAGALGVHAADPGAVGALRRGAVRLQIAIFFVYTGLEAATGAWCFTRLVERGEPLEVAGAWTTAYWGSIALGRVALGFVVERVGPDRLVRLATCAALAGALAYAALDGAPGRLGLVLLGASLAPVFPTLMARTPARVGGASAHAVGFQVSAATLGSAAFPALVGVGVARAGVAVIAPASAALAAALLVLHEALLRSTRGR